MNLARTFLRFFGFSLLAILVVGCSEPDIRLVNKVKTFDPRWADLNDKLSYLDRNLDMAEDRFEKDFAELEGMLGEIPDSLRDRTYRRNLANYDTLVMERDTIRAIFVESKATYSETVEEFNSWEKLVMDGSVRSAEGDTVLKKYKAIHRELDGTTDSVTAVLKESFDQHNMILRDLTRRMGIFQNFDIRMQ